MVRYAYRRYGVSSSSLRWIIGLVINLRDRSRMDLQGCWNCLQEVKHTNFWDPRWSLIGWSVGVDVFRVVPMFWLGAHQKPQYLNTHKVVLPVDVPFSRSLSWFHTSLCNRSLLTGSRSMTGNILGDAISLPE